VGLHPDETFTQELRTLRRCRDLHAKVTARLVELLSKLDPESVAVPEVTGVLGGRNDLIQFSFSGRRVVFEVFATPSQVPQDLRLLEQSSADVKIAVLLDREADEKVARAYFRKKPEAFPFLWVSHVLRGEVERLTLARLSELVDEGSALRRLRRLLAHPAGRSIEGVFRNQLIKMQAAIGSERFATLPKLNGKQVLALKTVAEIQKLGVAPERIRSLYQWLEEAVEHATELVRVGIPAFLLTDLAVYRAIWSPDDVADAVLVCGLAKTPHIVLELTELVTATLKDWGIQVPPQRFNFVHGYHEMVKMIPRDAISTPVKKRRAGPTMGTRARRRSE